MHLVRIHRAAFRLLYFGKLASQLNNRSRTGLTILIVFMAAADISLAKDIGYNRPKTIHRGALSQGRAKPVTGAIQNPYDAKSYMSRLSEKLSPEQRDILLRGPDIKKSEAITYGLRGPLSRPGIAVEPKKYQVSAKAEPAEKRWSLGEDLEKYRAYAVKEGSRYAAGNFKKAGFHAGLAAEDIVNVFTLASSERGKPLRENDGKPISFHLEKVEQTGGETLDNILITLYSSADLITFDSLLDLENEAYQNNHPLVRPFVYTGRSIGSACKTVENAANVPTFGYFDNVTGSAGMFFENAVETAKHGCEAATNLPRGCIYVIVGKNENLDKIQDWIWLVPLEYLSNVIEMKGLCNTQDYKNAFKEKGVIGSILEIGGSTYIACRTIDEIIDELKDDNGKKRPTEEAPAGQAPAPPTAPPTEGAGIEAPASNIYHFDGITLAISGG